MSRQGSIRRGRSSPIAGPFSARADQRGPFQQSTSRLEVAVLRLPGTAYRAALRPSMPIPTSAPHDPHPEAGDQGRCGCVVAHDPRFLLTWQRIEEAVPPSVAIHPGASRGVSRNACIHPAIFASMVTSTSRPRENPWLDMVEVQDSAAPDHDWNERDHSRVLRAQHPLSAARRAGPDHQPLEQLRLDKLQLRADAAVLAGAFAVPRCWNGSSRPIASAGSAGAATATPCRRSTTTSSCPWRVPTTVGRRCSGASPTSAIASVGIRRGCGWPRPPPTWRLARGAGRGGPLLHHPGSAPGQTLAEGRRRGVGRDPGGRRPLPCLHDPTPFGAIAGAVLL